MYFLTEILAASLGATPQLQPSLKNQSLDFFFLRKLLPAIAKKALL